ncbi:hypothetical protein Hanom_Chr11g01005401 [Helianthus anomalus]
MIHSLLIHINLNTNLILTRHNHIKQPSYQIMPALKLHRRHQPLAKPPPTRVKLKHILPFFQQQRRIIPIPIPNT